MTASAYGSEGARLLFLRAQAARIGQDSALQSYEATAYQRISAGLRIARVGRDRLFFRSETASRIRWRRGLPIEIEILGSRQVVPIIGSGPTAHRGAHPGLATTPIPYYPGREGIWIGTDQIRSEVNDREIVHPLALGAEAYYAYALGDSVAIRLPGGKTVQVVELLVRPRAPRWNVVVGALWFDRSSAQLVRAVYRLSETMDLMEVAREQGDHDVDSIPALVKPLITPMRADLHTVTIEYGLYKERFWLPRIQAAEGEAQVSFMRVPFHAEDRFEYANVSGTRDSSAVVRAGGGGGVAIDTFPLVHALDADGKSPPGAGTGPSPAAESSAHDRLSRRERRARRDSVAAVRTGRRDAECARNGSYVVARRIADSVTARVRVPCDSLQLTQSRDLPPSIYDPAEETFGEGDMGQLRKVLDMSLQPGWAPGRIAMEYGLADGYLRYNRVEGLSLGAGARLALGSGYVAHATTRIGVADREPNADLTLSRSDGVRTIAIGGYRRLSSANDWGNPLSFSSSLSTFLFGRDEGFYYRAAGVEVTAVNESGTAVAWRFFAERDATADVRTNFALAHAMSGGDFAPNIAATTGGVVGASVRHQATRGLDPAGWRLFSDMRAETGVGVVPYGRAALDVTTTHPVGAGVTAAVTGGWGVSGGGVPSQRLWYLGGTQTVRGEPAGAARGDAYWLARGELGIGSVAARPVLFYDAGWAGSRSDWTRQGGAVRGAGVGASFADGIVRIDLARGLAPVRQWRVDLYADARF